PRTLYKGRLKINTTPRICYANIRDYLFNLRRGIVRKISSGPHDTAGLENQSWHQAGDCAYLENLKQLNLSVVLVE
ncbi:hypothetical protein ACTXL8_18165, partial [Glutamicibacter arilaitensis]|uniref:hypothetical protein n=1 Tax=Glutamicibacter arilaitensis TaxID=256701 RepID=UPI003FD65334